MIFRSLLLQCHHFYHKIESRVSSNLKKYECVTRPNASHGFCVGLLLPALLCATCLRYNVTNVLLLTTGLSLGLLTHSILLLVLLFLSGRVMNEENYAGILLSGFIASLANILFGAADLTQSILCCLPFICVYSTGVRFALRYLPRCFTLGEAMLVMQAVTLFTYSCVLKVNHSMNETPISDLDVAYLVAQTGLTAVGLMVVQSYWTSKHLRALVLGFSCTAFIFLVFLHIILQKSSIIWVILFITDSTRMLLITSWTAWVIIAVLTIKFQTTTGDKATTSTRKIFHILAVAVFLPGLLLDVPLMTLASGVALAVIILLETLRVTAVVPISSYLNQAFEFYSDEKDAGGLSLTPIYLLVGIACPLALVPSESPIRELQLLSGVISIGIGDAVASWVGCRFGKMRWGQSNRTIEGTLFNIASQVGTIYLLFIYGVLKGEGLMYKGTVAAMVSGLTEAYTDQVDNLILPIVTMLTLILL